MSYRDKWKALNLTPAGLPVYLESEVEILKKKNVRIEVLQGDGIKPGELTLTTHRIFHHSDDWGHLFLSLSEIGGAKLKPGKFMRPSSKVLVFLNGQSLEVESAFEFAFKGGGREAFFQALETARERCAWVAAAPVKVAAAQPLGTSGAGITGLLRRQQQQQQHLNTLSAQAFADLDSLISKAKDMVAVIHRYTAAQAQRSNEDLSEKEEEEALKLKDTLLTIGYVNPVTKATAGTEFHNTLARQLADFLASRKILERQGGMITLHDLYCVYNRARGTELVSPDDLLKACELLKTLGLGMSLRKFSSGVTVVQSDLHDDGQMSTRLKEMAEDRSYLTPLIVSSALKIPVILSNQHLLLAEQIGYLCRDESVEGLLFYPNAFPDFMQ
mmetsp:Transcript_29278/g.37736  ORF Transcript_29278/g.37736 Transcript_29278/m.37736 type:complete len:386 (+) Transcript_29278:189-1346(+)